MTLLHKGLQLSGLLHEIHMKMCGKLFEMMPIYPASDARFVGKIGCERYCGVRDLHLNYQNQILFRNSFLIPFYLDCEAQQYNHESECLNL